MAAGDAIGELEGDGGRSACLIGHVCRDGRQMGVDGTAVAEGERAAEHGDAEGGTDLWGRVVAGRGNAGRAGPTSGAESPAQFAGRRSDPCECAGNAMAETSRRQRRSGTPLSADTAQIAGPLDR